LKHLWAPWRMKYVAGPKPEGCIFCRMIEQEEDEKNHIVYRGKHNFVVLNAFPYNSGHLMVVPYVHVGDIVELDDEQLCDAMLVARLCCLALQRCVHPEGINLGMNIGRAAGAGIDEHVHLHVVPRWSGDTNYMTTVGNVRVVPQSLAECAAELRPILKELAHELSHRHDSEQMRGA